MNAKAKLILLRSAAAVFAAAILGSCSEGFLRNDNDWAMKKGAQPAYVPLQVSKKVYR